MEYPTVPAHTLSQGIVPKHDLVLHSFYCCKRLGSFAFQGVAVLLNVRDASYCICAEIVPVVRGRNAIPDIAAHLEGPFCRYDVKAVSLKIKTTGLLLCHRVFFFNFM